MFENYTVKKVLSETETHKTAYVEDPKGNSFVIKAAKRPSSEFQRECSLLQQFVGLHLSRIINILHIDPECRYYTMEYLPGQDIYQYVSHSSALAKEEAVEIILQVTEGLAFVYETFNILHRDIKPHHILISPQRQIKLCGYGIIKTDHESGEDEVDNLTTRGYIRGTPLYLAPELIFGEKHSVQTDIFALGLTFYYMLTGEEFFKDPRAIITYAEEERPSQLEHPTIVNDIHLRKVLEGMIHRQKEKRLANYEVLLSRLQHLKTMGEQKGEPAKAQAQPSARGNFQKYTPKALLKETEEYKIIQAVDPATGTNVVIKAAKEVTPEFQRECLLLKQFSGVHFKHVANILYVSPSHKFYAMEYIDGVDICEYLKNFPEGMPINNAIDIAIKIARSLDLIHRKFQVLHRDIKPQHILLSPDLKVIKLCGFGIIKEDAEEEEESLDMLTMRGFVRGTPIYMAPELLFGEQHSIFSDMFSLGLTLYCMLTGNEFFEDTQDIISYAEKNLESAQFTNPVLEQNPELKKLLMKMLHREKNERFPDYSSLVWCLDKLKDKTFNQKIPAEQRETPAAIQKEKAPAPVEAPVASAPSIDKTPLLKEHLEQISAIKDEIQQLHKFLGGIHKKLAQMEEEARKLL